jgi:hypothetical protein
MVQINVPNRQAVVQVANSAPVVFELEDKGGAHVAITISIQGFPPITHDDTWGGVKSVPVHIPSGSYPFTVLIEAYKYGALNPHYDSTVKANGIVVASANGNVPSAQASDIGFDNFSLRIA